MKLEILDNLASLEQTEGEWFAFTSQIEGLTPFQLPAWQLTWWRHFGSGDLHVMVFRQSEKIVAFIPAFRHVWEARPQITLLGSGISDYLDPPIAPSHSAEVVSALRTHLLEDSDWKILNWQDLSAGTPLTALSAGNLQARATDDTPCSQITLTGEFEDYWSARSKDLRRNLRRYGHRAEQAGEIEFAVTSKAEDALLHELVRLHAERWGQRGETGMIEANHSAAFLRHLARQFERLDMLRFFSLCFKDEVVAVSIGFLYRNVLYSYLSAFDPHYDLLGFGRKLLHDSLRHAWKQRYTAWNFCRGEEAYKFSFGATSIPKCRLMLTRAAAHTA